MYYYRNLFSAISSIENNPIQPIVFVGKKINIELMQPLKPFVTIAQSSLFDQNSLLRNISRFFYLISGSNIVRNNFLKKHDIQIISHSNIIEKSSPFKIINWVPDFQHVHLPEMFSKKELLSRNRMLNKIITRSDTVIVSSHDALIDLHNFTQNKKKSARILHFVSNINIQNDDADHQKYKQIKHKYKIGDKFFFLPNQFWKHKNHQIVLEAANILKKSGTDISVLCSGYMSDYRNINHIEQLKQYIARNDLTANIKFLGLIERDELITLMRFSLAVINPSLFEGWSSTVEEAKSIGKSLIISNLGVHREQKPPSTIYFNPHDAKELSEILKHTWARKKGGPEYELEKNSQVELAARVKRFGEDYLDIVKECWADTKG